MCLSTVSKAGLPDGRIVLMHDVNATGIAFFTDRRSPKGRALAAVPRAALTFYWGPLERQVRLRGAVHEAPSDEADTFFAERPRRSKITAWACEQSAVTADRDALEAQMEAAERRFADAATVPRPPYWQAYRLTPRVVEFWHARSRRLHDRIVYTSEGADWSRRRLAP
jgi:pyridoxamine 5'-phosphate oxidase